MKIIDPYGRRREEFISTSPLSFQGLAWGEEKWKPLTPTETLDTYSYDASGSRVLYVSPFVTPPEGLVLKNLGVYVSSAPSFVSNGYFTVYENQNFYPTNAIYTGTMQGISVALNEPRVIPLSDPIELRLPGRTLFWAGVHFNRATYFEYYRSYYYKPALPSLRTEGSSPLLGYYVTSLPLDTPPPSVFPAPATGVLTVNSVQPIILYQGELL